MSNLSQCPRDIQERMVTYFTQADEEYDRRVAEGIGLMSGGNGSGNGQGCSQGVSQPMGSSAAKQPA